MFCTVKLRNNLEVGTVVQFNTDEGTWDTATTHQDTIGVISSAPAQDEETLEWWARVTFAGTTFALADRTIPDQGGKLTVNNGRVFVDNLSNANGIIAPLTRGESTRLANDLVLVDIR
jgi:hypothetical protein